MEKIFFFMCSLLYLTACTQSDVDDHTNNSIVKCSLSFANAPELGYEISPQKDVRNSLSDIKDLNIFIYNKDYFFNLFTNKQHIDLELPKGSYNIIALGNMGFDLEKSMGYSDPASFIDALENYDMSNVYPENAYSDLLSIKQSAIISQGTSLNIALVRLDAKIDIAINVAPEFAKEIEIQTIALLDTPEFSNLFSGGTQSTPICTMMQNQNKTADNNYTFYCRENIKPANLNITTPQQKNKNTAPFGSSYILIHALHQKTNTSIQYRIYCGRNTTTDFTIQRNTATKYNITILSSDETDTRIENTSVLYELSNNATPIPYYGPDSTHYINIGKFHPKGPYSSWCTMHQKTTPAVVANYNEFSIDNGVTWKKAPASFSMPQAEQSFLLRTKIKPEYNFFNSFNQFTYQANFELANHTAASSYFVDMNQTESITVPFALHYRLFSEPGILDINSLFLSVNGTADDGYNVSQTECWVNDIHNKNGLILQYVGYDYVDQSKIGLFDSKGVEIKMQGDQSNAFNGVIHPNYSTDLFMRIKGSLDTVALDGDGATSNCYIIEAQSYTDAFYVTFDATTIGNGVYMVDGVNILPEGVSSIKIAPASLSGGAILENGRAKVLITSFSTIPEIFKIHAYDEKKNILWSWMIIIDYSHIYQYRGYTPKGGLDRYTIPLKGQYQWGRKDMLSNSAITQQPSNNLLHSIRNPNTYTSQPTDWLSSTENNYTIKKNLLWGGKNKIKTIYDPCPKGYKVSVGSSVSFDPKTEVLKFTNTGSYYYMKNTGGDLDGVSRLFTLFYNEIYWAPDYSTNSVNTYQFTQRPNPETGNGDIAISTSSTTNKRSNLGYIRCIKE